MEIMLQVQLVELNFLEIPMGLLAQDFLILYLITIQVMYI